MEEADGSFVVKRLAEQASTLAAFLVAVTQEKQEYQEECLDEGGFPLAGVGLRQPSLGKRQKRRTKCRSH